MGQAYRDQGPGTDELQVSAKILPRQQALHVYVQLLPQRDQGLVLGLQPGRSRVRSEAAGHPPPTTHSSGHTPGHPPADGLLGLLVGRGHEEAHRGHGGLAATTADHLPMEWLRRAHQLALVTLVHGHLGQPELSECSHAHGPPVPPLHLQARHACRPHLHLLVVAHSQQRGAAPRGGGGGAGLQLHDGLGPLGQA